jgi:hypothetical protein
MVSHCSFVLMFFFFFLISLKAESVSIIATVEGPNKIDYRLNKLKKSNKYATSLLLLYSI